MVTTRSGLPLPGLPGLGLARPGSGVAGKGGRRECTPAADRSAARCAQECPKEELARPGARVCRAADGGPDVRAADPRRRRERCRHSLSLKRKRSDD